MIPFRIFLPALCVAAVASSLINHPAPKTVAILPFDVTFDGDSFDTSVISMDDEEEQTGYSFQADLCWWLNLQKEQPSTVLQGADSTDSLLSRANIRYKELFSKDKSAICKILGVDEVIVASASLSRPWSFHSLTIQHAIDNTAERAHCSGTMIKP